MKKMRIMVLALMVIAMAAGLLSGPAAAHAEGSTPEIVLGAGEIAKATSTARNYTVWFGKYKNNAIQWRVLSDGADSSLPVSGEGKALLISKDILASIQFNPSSAAEPRNAWARSNAQTWCTNFLANWAEGSAERAAISPTTVTETADYTYKDTVNNYSRTYGPASLSSESFFFLSAQEAATYFSNDNDRKAQGADCWWWLRSPLTNDAYSSGCVDIDGWVRDNLVHINNGARPAFNLNLSSVLFSSRIQSNPYKLTLADSNRTIGIQPGAAITRDSATQITVPYQIDSGSNHVSLLITNKDDAWTAGSGWSTGAVKQDYATAAVSETNGTVTFTLPDNYETNKGNWKVWLLAEQVNGEHETDCASAPVAITVPNWIPVEKVTLSPSSAALVVGGDAVKLTASVSQNNATDKKVKWSVTGTGVALNSNEACSTALDLNTAISTTEVYAKGTAAGNATVTVTSNADSSKQASCSVTVKGIATVTTLPTAKSWVDNGNAQALVTAGAAVNGTMQYVIGTETAPGTNWSDAIPTEKDIGKYYVWYKAKGNGNYVDSAAAYVTARIYFPVTFKVVGGTWADGTTEKTLDVSRLENEDLALTLQSSEIPQGTPDSSHTSAGTWDEDPNEYVNNRTITSAKTFTFTAKTLATVTTAPDAVNPTYNGSAQALVTAGAAVNGTMQYTIGTETVPGTDWSDAIPKRIDAGTYYVWYKAQGDDATHLDSEPKPVSAGITPKSITGAAVTLEKYQLGYTSAEQTVAVTGVTIDGLTLTANDYTVTGNTGTNATDYTVTVTGKGNYTGTASGHFTINQATLTITAKDQEYTYNGEIQGEGDTVYTDPADIDRKITISGLKGSDAVTRVIIDGQATNAGTYDDGIFASGVMVGSATGNYTIAYMPGKLKINPAPLTITAASDTKVYDGTALTKNSYQSTGLVGDDRIASVTITGSQTNAGSSENVPSAAKIVNENDIDVTTNYAITHVNGTLTVTPKSITGATVTLNQTQLGYTSAEQTVTVTGVTIDGLTLTADDYTVTGNTGTNAEDYTVTVTGKGNFQDTATAEWKIVEAGMTLSAPDVSATYDGQPHGITVTVTEPKGAAIKFKDEAGAYTLDASPTITSAGSLVVGYQITADNYLPVTGSATVTVAPKAATVTASAQTVKEGESIQTGTDFATLTDALSGHTLSAVTLTAENGKIVPSTAKILDANGNDVTGNYTLSYQPGALTTLGKISRTVTFKVVNGAWDDGTAEAKTVALSGFAGDTLKLAATDIPAVGTKPGDNFKAGAWDVTPSAEAEITVDTTYTYTYADKDAISQTVTFKVVNGSWDDGTTADKVVTLNGLEGAALKLAANQIPAVGTKPNGAFKAGSWDVAPNPDTAITKATTYTYTYALRDAYLVTVTNDGNGTGSASPNSGYEGTEVTLTAYPAQGYKFKEWQVVSGSVTITDNKFKIGTANVGVKAVFEAEATGSHAGEAQTLPGAPEIQCSNMQEVVESIIAAIKNGEMKGISEEVRQAVLQPDAQVLVLLISAPLSSDQIPAEDWADLQKLQEDAGYTGIVPFDITLMLNVNGKNVAEVHETKIPVKFSVGIMENLLGTPRTFSLVNVHNGAAKVIPTTRRGNFLDGESTEFSTYAIAYKDEETRPIDPTKFDDVAVPSDSFTFKKVWQGDSEKSIDFTLYKQDGTVYHHGFDKKIVSKTEWRYNAWFSEEAACYVIEQPIPGYQTKYVNVGVYAQVTDRCCDGGTIINKKIPKTGDEEPLLLWAGMVALGAVGLTAALVIGKKRKANQ